MFFFATGCKNSCIPVYFWHQNQWIWESIDWQLHSCSKLLEYELICINALFLHFDSQVFSNTLREDDRHFATTPEPMQQNGSGGCESLFGAQQVCVHRISEGQQ